MAEESDNEAAEAEKLLKAKRGGSPLPPDPFGEPPREKKSADGFEPAKFIHPGVTGGLG